MVPTQTQSQSIYQQISFHCTICLALFEHEGSRVPVILPCGHTYLCAQCSKSLKECPECSTSLFMAPPISPTTIYEKEVQPTPQRSISPPPLPLYQSSTPGRNSYSHHVIEQRKPPSTPIHIPIALPLPTNAVMLKLIEAARKECNAKRTKYPGICEDNDNNSNMYGNEFISINNDDDLSETSDEVRNGIDAVSGFVGTYAVAEKKGLEILTNKPEIYDDEWLIHEKSLASFCTEELSTDSMYISNDAENIPATIELDAKASEEECTPEATEIPWLDYKQIVQVVDLSNGCAKLARGQGYVIATCEQLVKVSASDDDACLIEGMLKTAFDRKKEINKHMRELHLLETNLIQELEEALLKPSFVERSGTQISFLGSSCSEDETVDMDTKMSPSKLNDYESSPRSFISAEMATSPDNNISFYSKKDPQQLTGRTFSVPHFPNKDSSNSIQDATLKRFNLDRHVEFSNETEIFHHSPPPASAMDQKQLLIANARKNQLKKQLDEMEKPREIGGCGTFLGLTGGTDTEEEANSNILCQHPLSQFSFNMRSRRHNSPSPVRRSNQRSSEPSGIDFRTGLSGHLALMSTKAHQDPILRGKIRMMGEHKGLSRIGILKRQMAPPNASLGAVSESPKSPNLSTKTW